MKIVAKLITCLLLLLTAGMPVMACMQPDRTMSSEEMACCKKMANDCGEMGNSPSGHDCCKKTEIRTASAMLQSTSTLIGVDWSCAIAILPDKPMRHEQVNSLLASMVHGHSPPESPPSFPQVLRI